MNIFGKEYWDSWLQKLGSFIVSVKMIIISSSFVLSVCFYKACEHLLKSDKLNGEQFVKLVESDLKYLSVILGAVLATRGAIQVADVLKSKVIDKVKEEVNEIENS